MNRVRVYLLVILASLLLLEGLGGRQPEVMLLAAPLLVYLFAGLWLAPRRVKLHALRDVSAVDEHGLQLSPPSQPDAEFVIPAGSKVSVRLLIQNRGSLPVDVLLADREFRRAARLAPGESLDWEYQFLPPRGRYHFPDLKVVAGDPLGLFSASLSLPVDAGTGAPSALFVMPRSLPLKHIVVRPPLLRGFAGPLPSRTPGSGTDFFGVRLYQPGDPLRRVNWRVSSRSERWLFTNQFEGERFADIGLILDARKARNLASPTGDLLEYGVLAAASLGKALLQDGHRVSLLVCGHSVERVPPGAGRMHSERLLRALAETRPVQEFALENLRYLPTRIFPPRSQIVFISSLAGEDFDLLVNFRSLGYDVLVISPDPVQFEADVLQASDPVAAGSLEVEQAWRLARIERTALLRRLERLGVWVVDWPVNQPLHQHLRARLAPLRQGRRILGVI